MWFKKNPTILVVAVGDIILKGDKFYLVTQASVIQIPVKEIK